jgi:hypothetical protein
VAYLFLVRPAFVKPLTIVLFMAWVTLICGVIHAAQYGYTAYVTHGAISALKLEGKEQERIDLLLRAYYRSVGEGAAVAFTQACIIVYARKLRRPSHRV